MAPRGANFTLQNSDWLLAIGARLDLVVTGYAPRNLPARPRRSWSTSTRRAPQDGHAIEVPVHADARFIEEMLRQIDASRRAIGCVDRALPASGRRYPVVLPEYRGLPDGVSTYVLAEAIAERPRTTT